MFEVPATKRTLYYYITAFIDYYNASEEEHRYNPSTIGIFGIKNCGKTTLLRQLANYYNEKKADCVFYKEFKDKEDYLTLEEDVLTSDKEIVILDEVGRISSLSLIKFCSDVKKLSKAGKAVIYAGSVYSVMDSLTDFTDSLFLMPDKISYYEYLCWENNIEADMSLSLKEYEGLSDKKMLEKYLKSSFFNISEEKGYLKAMVQESTTAVENRFMKDLRVKKGKLRAVMEYYFLKALLPDSQWAEWEGNNKKVIRKFNILPKKVRKRAVELLYSSGLLRKSDLIYSGKRQALFTLPTLAAKRLKKKIKKIKPLEDLYTEQLIFDLINRIYMGGNKFNLSYGYKNHCMVIYEVTKDKTLQISTVNINNCLYNAEEEELAKDSLKDLSKSCKDFDILHTYSQLEDSEQSPNRIENHRLVLYLSLFAAYTDMYFMLEPNLRIKNYDTLNVKEIIQDLNRLMPLRR